MFRGALLAVTKPPVVSVVVPAFNASRTIRATLQSVLTQTFDDIEVVVVDDGSTDDTAQLAEGMGHPVRCISVANGGVSRARNLGTAESAGRYLAFLDADDLWMPKKLEEQVRLLEDDADAGGCYVGVVKVDLELRELERLPAREFEDLCASLLLHSSVIPSAPSSLLVRREVDAQIGGFDPRFSQCADWDYLLRLSRTTKLRPVTIFLASHVTGDWNMSRDIQLLERDTFDVLDCFYAEERDPSYLAMQQRCHSNHWMILSGSYLHAGDIRSSVRCLAAGIRAYPRNIVRPLALPLRWIRRRVARVAPVRIVA